MNRDLKFEQFYPRARFFNWTGERYGTYSNYDTPQGNREAHEVNLVYEGWVLATQYWGNARNY